MSMPIMEIEGISKWYRIGAVREPYLSLREELSKKVRRMSKVVARALTGSQARAVNNETDFWALKDVSFSVKEGEAVGIIGRNGAGKSTLLKILSQITPPTKGRITMRGRVASLLEVGTGFHPELTGRENIFLNGAILGMTRMEIRRKYEEIVEFAEVEKFLDTPVKHYSSGMYVRLAFAVAAHLEPEILLVDEVLAVGDVQFQKKCLGKMEEVTKGGRTILFVSHNMSAVESLCSRGIVLNSGGLALDANPEQAIQFYLDRSYSLIGDNSLEDRTDRTGSGRVRCVGFRIRNNDGGEATVLQSGRNYRFEVEYLNGSGGELSNVVCSIDVYDERNTRLVMLRTSFSNITLTLQAGRGKFYCAIDDLPISNGSYRVSLFLSHAESETLDMIVDAAFFQVDGGDFFGTGSHGMPTHCRMLTRSTWSNE